MADAVAKLLALLDLEFLDENRFRGQNAEHDHDRIFGGQVLGQALVAAQRTVEEPDRLAHSLHGYFLRAGDPTIPILFEVDRIRDGRSFTTRRVVAIQRGRAIFNMSASFQTPEPGLAHQDPIPDATPPEELPSPAEYVEQLRRRRPSDPANPAWFEREFAIEQRFQDPIDWYDPSPLPALQRVWMRSVEALPESQALQQAIFAYASDLSLLDTCVMPHGVSVLQPDLQVASLDHAIWFHRPLRMDDWIHMRAECPSTASARGFAHATFYARDGTLVASATQEGLLRTR